MGIREGSPQPMIVMLVGVGRERRVEGSGRLWERVRRYSWQICVGDQDVSEVFEVFYIEITVRKRREVIPRKRNDEQK